jgi:hypothetical protein
MAAMNEPASLVGAFLRTYSLEMSSRSEDSYSLAPVLRGEGRGEGPTREITPALTTGNLHANSGSLNASSSDYPRVIPAMDEGIDPHDDTRQAAYAARDAFAQSLGDVDPDVLAPLINPSFMGGPLWPDLRQAWRVIRHNQSTMILSDGLSDPFSDDPEPNPGFGLEVLAESNDALEGSVQGTWLFDLVYQVCQQCAFHGGVRALIDRAGLVSLELPLSETLRPVATASDKVGVLLGTMPPELPSGFQLPSGSVRIITAKLLWPSELEYVASGGKAAREHLAQKFLADGTLHRSSLQRKPVV